MKKTLLLLPLFLLFLTFGKANDAVSTKVTTAKELKSAIKTASPGDEIIMANKTWNDIQIVFQAEGTKDAPIILRAETAGKVFIEGVSNLKIAGKYLEVHGLYFRNGYTPSQNVIAFRVDSKTIANNCRVTNCVIEDFNQPQRDTDDLWVQFYGRKNTLDHCYLAGKINRGPTIRVDLKGNESIKNYHQIVNNHFGPRPRKGGPSGESIQLGSSFTSMSPSNTTIANNLFEECNGEVEVISSKTNFNEIKNNVFYKSEGSVVTRHGNYCTIDGNYFIGDGKNTNYGGIRIINTGHWITNNYFFNIIGENFRSPIAIMNGIPKSPLNRYNQVTDVVVAYNSFIDCKSPLQFGVGTNISQKDVLPLSEIRSARPLRTIVANNAFYNAKGDATPIIEHDKADGVDFISNVINNNGVDFNNSKDFKVVDFELSKVNDYLFTTTISSDIEPYFGFEFETISNDLLGNSRTQNNTVGATISKLATDPLILDKSKYGANWFSNETGKKKAKTHSVSSKSGDLAAKIAKAKSGDILSLKPGIYTIAKSLVIDKSITIQSRSSKKVTIVYSGEENTPAFELVAYGLLTLKNVNLVGKNKQYAFATLKKGMSNHFGLEVLNSEIKNFDFVLKAYKESFAEEITFSNTTIKDCANGLELSEEINNKGDYNTEYLTVDNCTFKNVKSNVIDYYRGGYDESTIGGNLLVSNSTFTNCGENEKNNILINNTGIVNVKIANNTFKNNSVKLVALLWGAKNNTHNDNKVMNSGEIIVQENIKQKLVY